MSNKITDAELSLAVARIMWSEHEWVWLNDEVGAVYDGASSSFRYTTDDALGKMCVWLANRREFWEGEVGYLLKEDNPHRAIAEAIVESQMEIT